MKKVLLATTALIGFAGAAAAEITLSGYAEIGVNGGNNGFETQFHNDWQVNFNFSGETDGGLSFGGSVQIEENNSQSLINGTPRIDDEAFWVSGSFGKVTLGETKGALDWAVPDIFSGTSLSDDHSTHAGAYWNTGLDGGYDDQIARYEYSFGDWGVAVSVEMDDRQTSAFIPAVPSTGPGDVGTAAIPAYTQGDPTVGIGVKWAGQMGGADANAGIGYQDNGDVSTWALAGHAKWGNGFEVSLGYADFDSSATTAITDYVGNGVAVDSWAGIGVA
ncbi:MAG: porin, partial [Albidovulum sp.]